TFSSFAQVRRLKIRRTNEAAQQLLLQHGKTRTETAVGSDAISPIRCGKTTASDFTEKTKPLVQEGGSTASVRGEGQGSVRRDQGPPPTGTACGSCSKVQADDPGPERRTVTSQGHRADSDSDGKTQDTGRLAVCQERTMTARGVKAHYPLTGAARRRCGAARRRDDSIERTGSRTAEADLQQKGDGTEGPSRRRDDDRRPPSEGQGSADQGPLATETASAGASGLGSAGATVQGPQDHGGDAAFSQCVNTRILRSQGPEDTSRDRTDSDSDGKTSYTAGKIRSATWRGPVIQDPQDNGVGADGPSRRQDDGRRPHGEGQSIRTGGRLDGVGAKIESRIGAVG
ncbi:hypothetical protein CF326_g8257, partial [Tilletia indica]